AVWAYSWLRPSRFDAPARGVVYTLRMAPIVAHESESTVQTACPLDCPDGCSLSVTVRDGRVVAIEGSDANPVTDGYSCAKVRRFHERVYGDARLRFPLARSGPK